MVDAYETFVQLRLKVPAGEVERVKRMVESAISPSVTSKIRGAAALAGGVPKAGTGMLGAARGGAGVLGAAAAGAAVVVSSPSLMGTLKVLVRTVGLILRPLGDIVSVGLRPVLDVLRPIGMFFRIIMKPYIQHAMQAMRLGRRLAAKGESGMAGQAYALGAAYLLKPFFDSTVAGFTILAQDILMGIKVLGVGLLKALAPWSGAAEDFAYSMDSMILDVGAAGAKIIVQTSIMMEEWLVELKLGYENIKNNVSTSMGAQTSLVGEGYVRMIQAATGFFVTSVKVEDQIKTTFDNIVNYGAMKVNELNAMLKQPAVAAPAVTGGGGATYQLGGKTYTEAEILAMPTPGWGGGTTQGAGATGSWDFNNIGHGYRPAGFTAGDFVWRSGQAPLRISPSDTVVGTKSGTAGGISIDIGGIRIDKVSSDYDIDRIANRLTERIIDKLRSMK